MRKLIVYAGVAACLGAVLMGCGGGDDDDGATPTKGAAEPAELGSAAILERNKNSIVKIITTNAEGTGGGTGIVWEDESHVVTNAHVVIGAGSIKVVDPLDGSRTFSAKTVALSACDDVALLQVERGQNLKPATIGDSEGVKPGDRVVALGFPDTLSSGPNNAIVNEGSVSRVHATFEFSGQRDLIQHAVPINPGNSGGPLFNTKGQVIGINAYTAIGRQSENYAITINEAKAVAKELKDGKNLDYIGISVIPNSSDYANQEDLAYIDGLVVTAVDPGSPADEADPSPFQVGFLIFEMNGTSVESVGEYCDIIRSQSSGKTLNIRFGAYDTNGNPFNNFQYKVELE